MVTTRKNRFRIGAAILVASMVAAACGGGSKDEGATADSTTTTVDVSSESTTTTLVDDTVVDQSTTSTSSVGKASATTAKKAGTSSKTTAIKSNVGNKPSGGISNVTAPPTTAPSKEIQPGGTITWLKGGDIASLDPVKANTGGTADAVMMTAVYDILVYTDPDSLQVLPQTAQSLTSTDAQVWTLKLQPNIKFSDGTPYDAEAVRFNWERIANPANATTRAASAQLIQTMEVVDPVTLRITLKTKNAVFPQAVGQIPFIGSPTAIKSLGDKFGQTPVGAGAFTLNKWERDNQMVLVRNPNYWYAPRPYIDQLIVKPMTDEVQRTNTVLAGQANFTFVQTPDSVDRAEKANHKIYPQVINGGIVLHMNTKKAPFNDVRLRQAVAMAIDLNDYSKVVNSGKTAPMDSIFRPESPFYDAGILQQAYNPTRAQQLFDEVSAEKKGTIEFKLASFTAVNYALSAQYIASKLNTYKNVKVTVVPEAGTLHQQNINSGNFEMTNTGIPVVDPEPSWTGVYTCNASPSPTGWCSSAFDAAVEENRTTLDANKRITALKNAQKEFYSQVPSYFVERRYNWLISTPNFEDVEWVNDGLPLFDRIWLRQRG